MRHREVMIWMHARRQEQNLLINMEQDTADQEWKKARHKLC